MPDAYGAVLGGRAEAVARNAACAPGLDRLAQRRS
jgi:hypothetical protein